MAGRLAQPACPRSHPDLGAARKVAYVWGALSEACHLHAYELAPTASELGGWIDTAGQLVAFMRDEGA